MDRFTLFVTITVLALASYTDISDRKVPNILTFPMILFGLICAGFPFRGDAYIRILWLFFFFVIGYFRFMGMGDLKLCMAVLALRGINETSIMLLSGTFFLFIYCLFTETELTLLSFKDLFHSFLYHTGLIKRSDVEYPFAFFLLLGYGVNILL